MQAHTIQEALTLLAERRQDYIRLIEKAAFDIGLYKPDGHDPQTPHARDELYIVASGSGEFVCGGEVRSFAPGDALFVPAGIEHRFRDFTPDFATWVIFFGPRPASKI